jgi:Domain of unknown function (DUF4188)
MRRPPNRTTADLSAYPDLVVIYLGMRVNSPKGVKTLTSFGAKIRKSVEAQPDGLLLHENLLFSLIPPHAGMRQYWRDFDSLERWARSLPHQQWWQQFLRDRGGTGFWHETYFPRRPDRVGLHRHAKDRPGQVRPGQRPPVARCSRPAAAWACGKEANRRQVSQKKSCTGGEATTSLVSPPRRLGNLPHTPEYNTRRTAVLARHRPTGTVLCVGSEL